MMIVQDGRFASPIPGADTVRMVDRISDILSGSAPLMAAAAARMASSFPGAIFRPSGIEDREDYIDLPDPVRAVNALAMLAAAIPEDLGEVSCDRGTFRVDAVSTSVSGVVLTPAMKMSGGMSPDALALLVNTITDRCGDYCVMGARPETEIVPALMASALDAIGPNGLSGVFPIPLVLCEDGDIVICDISLEVDISPEDYGPEI